MKILAQSSIQAILDSKDFTRDIEGSFVAFSNGQAVIPPVAELLMDKGETHIKYGFIKDQPYFVIKVASGFYQNPQIGLSSSQGVVILFSLETGEPVAFLQDGGILTNYRTAYAGAIAAKYLAPTGIQAIGIIGSGIQAQLQAQMIAAQTGCNHVMLWARNSNNAERCAEALASSGLQVELVDSASRVAEASQIIVTTTPSEQPLIKPGDLSGAKLIIAVGSDTAEKQELDTNILLNARLITDSRAQATLRGELSHLLKISPDHSASVSELGEIIAGKTNLDAGYEGITVVDLTGIATQDLAIAQGVLNAALENSE